MTVSRSHRKISIMGYAETKLFEVVVEGKLFGLLPGTTSRDALDVYALTQGFETFEDMERRAKRHADVVEAALVTFDEQGVMTFVDQGGNPIRRRHPRTLVDAMNADARSVGFNAYSDIVLRHIEHV